MSLDLGFLDNRDPAWLTNLYFPSKLGGKPAWLALDNLPSKEALQCKECGNPKVFLCQIYAPYEDEYNFHRSVYVFVCRTPACQKPNSNGNVSVFRCQLPRVNDFYSAVPPDEEGTALPALPCKKKICSVCGCSGPMSCGRCKQTAYCSQSHQKAHWPLHKKVCLVENASKADEEACNKPLPAFVLPEWEIIIEAADNDEEEQDDPEEGDEESADEQQKRLEAYEKLVAEGKAGELKDVDSAELEKYTEGAEEVDDQHFDKFKKATSDQPDQILRYKRNGSPLWITDATKTIAHQLDIPKCENCGGARQFEFQIMPQMLAALNDDQLDWGVLAVYTCAASCKTKEGEAYVPEYVIKQDIVEVAKD